MSEYFNSFDSNMYHENQNTGMGDENNGLHTEAPKQTRKKKHTGRAGRTAKRIGAITLSAVLFGGVAAGTFQGNTRSSGIRRSRLKAHQQEALQKAPRQERRSPLIPETDRYFRLLPPPPPIP